ncbi:GNAT family N-acetyltransferase [Streptomyces sp. NPDC090025]|uniref:GNAT family N-acetyltransferase n=1 Tax=Streptomyces sp. NPDC090025 TaxID=3365922 RepID=UPI0038357CEC
MFALPLRDNAELRPLEIWHAEEFAAHMDRARDTIRPWVGQSFVAEGVEGARGTLGRYADRRAKDAGGLWGIWLDGTLVGGVLFAAFDAAAGSCEVGCWLEPDARGRGLITDACTVLVDWALIERGLHRAEWQCRADNENSVAVARRLGMTLEGELRETWPYEGVRHNQQIWAVLADEWRARRRTA